MDANWSGRLLLTGVTLVILWSVAPLRADMVGHWAFDEASNDGVTPNSGTGGQVLKGRLVGDARLQANVSDGQVTRVSALALDGDGDWVRIDRPVIAFGAGRSFTTAAWIKTRASKMALLGKDDAHQRQANKQLNLHHLSPTTVLTTFMAKSQYLSPRNH